MQYEIALSFARSQRGYVENVAFALQCRGVKVFFDEFEDAQLAGCNLVEELKDVFENRAKFAVIFSSQAYLQSQWTRLERNAILSRRAREQDEYVIQVRFDDTVLPELPSELAFLQACKHLPVELALLILHKLGINPPANKASDVPPPRTPAFSGEVEFDYSNFNGCYIIGCGNLEFETKWTKASDRAIHTTNDRPSINGVALAENCHSIAEVTNASKLDFTSRCRTVPRDGIVVLRNPDNIYAALHVLDIKDKSRKDDQDQLRFRYVIQSNGSDSFDEVDDK